MKAETHVKRMIARAEKDGRKQIYHSLSSMMLKAFKLGEKTGLNSAKRRVVVTYKKGNKNLIDIVKNIHKKH